MSSNHSQGPSDLYAALSSLGGFDLLPLVFEHAPLGIAVLRAPSPDGDWRFVLANEEYCRITGTAFAPGGPMVGRTIREVYPPAVAESIATTLEEIRRTGQSFTLKERQADARDGSEQPWFDIHTYPLRDEGGRVVAVLSLVQDVTDAVLARRRAEEDAQAAQAKVAEAERKYRELVQHAPAGIYTIDFRTKRFTTINDAATRMSGYSREELLTMNPFDIMDEDSQARFQARIAAWLRGDKPEPNVEYKFRCKDGQLRDIVLNATFTRDERGLPLGAAVVAHDITERKQAEEALAETERKYREMVQLAPTAIYEIDFRTTRFTTVNDAMVQATGYTRDELLAMNPFELLDEESRADFRSRIAQWHGGEEPARQTEYRIRTKGGGTIHAVLHTTFRCDKEGRPLGAAVVAHDVTERRRMEEAVRDSQRRFQALVESTSDFIWEMDTHGAYTYCSPQLRSLWGFEPQEFIGKTPFDMMPPEDRARGLAAFAQLAATGVPFRNLQARTYNAAGEMAYLEMSGIPFFGATGELKGYRGISRDVTERVRAEEELRRQASIQAAISRILGQALSVESEEDLGRACLAVAQELTQSRFGYINELGADGQLCSTAYINPGWEACRMVDRAGHKLPLPGLKVAGLHGWVLQNGASLLTNDPAGHAQSIGTPQGHPAVTSYLGVPLREQGRVIGLLAVGNREGGYGVEQQRALEAIAPVIVQALLRKRAEEAARGKEQDLRDLNETLEGRVAERTILAEQRAQQMRGLAAELARAEERERRRLAQLLHDHLQQILAAAMLQVNIAERRAATDVVRTSLRAATDLLTEALDASRSLTAELSPAILHDVGLPPALQWLGRWVQKSYGLHVAVEVAEPPQAPRIPEDVASLLFHSSRELLFNVVKHAGVNAATLHLDYPNADAVQVTIADAGRGMDAGRIDSLELPSAAGREGLGLPSIRERLAYVGGQFILQSAPGQGTRISMAVPLQTGPVGLSPVAAVSPTIQAPSIVQIPPAAAREPEQALRKLRLLVADDHAIVRRGLAQLLQSQPDLQVVGEAADGLEALELALELAPDVVLMDLNMPHMDGIEATRRITAELPGITVIGLSMFDEAEKEMRMRQAGAAAYVAKGGPPESLLAAIRAFRGRE